MVVTSGSGGGGFAGASSYGSSGPYLALSRPGLWLYGCFFHCRRDFYRLRERQLLFLLTEHGLMRMSSLLMAQMEQVRIASCSGLLMAGKSHVAAICLILAASSVDISPGFLLMVLQNFYRSLTVNCVGS